MPVKTKALVLSSVKYSEADLIVSCYTRADGVRSYFLRSILKAKRARLKPSYFQPLTQLEIVAAHKSGNKLGYIREAKIAYPYSTIHSEMTKSAVVLFLSEILKNCIREEQPNRELFDFLQDSFQWLDNNSAVANFHIVFLLRLSEFLGFYPDASEKEKVFFDIKGGNFKDQKINEFCIKGNAVEKFKLFFEVSFDTMETIKLSKKNRAGILDLLLLYYQYHVQGYKKPRSLPVLHQLFS